MRRSLVTVIGAIVAVALVFAASPVAATVSGVDGRIAFVSDVSGLDQIYLIEADGSNVEQVTAFDDDAGDQLRIVSLAWSPDGQSLAFDVDRDDPQMSSEIWAIDADGTDLRYVTGGSSPSWSPDGESIAFSQRSVGVVNGLDTRVITMMDLATGRQTILTDPGDWIHMVYPDRTTSDYAPVWTPDGQEIVFARHIPGSASIWNFSLGAVDVETGSVRGGGTGVEDWIGQSTPGIDVDPSGERVVLSVNYIITSPYWLEVLDLSLSEPAESIPLPDDMAVYGKPSVAPSGNRVAVVLGPDVIGPPGPQGIWTLGLDGSDPVALIQGREPAWQPVNPYPIGLIDPTLGEWHLRYPDSHVESFFYGNPGDVPFMGDWDCDGVATPGLYRRSDGYVYLRNSNTQGIADVSFYFGNPGDVPIAGDFDGDGCDTVSIYRPDQQRFHIINHLGAGDAGLGAADLDYVFGDPGDTPIAGDFNGDGIDTVGLHRASTGLVYYRNTHTQGNADNQFLFGNPDDRFVTHDWNHDGSDTPAVFRPADTTMYFRFTNTEGPANARYIWGDSDWLPVTGTFMHP